MISLGTNSTRLLIAEGMAIVRQATIGTRLGEGLRERGELGAEPMRRTLEAIAEHAATAKRETDAVAVIATSAMRRAHNAAAFCERIEGLTGVEPRILSGDEEARCAYLGAVATLGTDGVAVGHDAADASHARFAVVDVGGGSTECALGTRTQPELAVSCEIGAVRLTEALPALAGAVPERARGEVVAAARDHAARALEALPREPGRLSRVAIVGGTATLCASMILDRERDEVPGRAIETGALAALLDRILALDLDARKALPHMIPQRADILPAGIVIALVALERLGVAAFTVTAGDLLLGYLLSTEPERARGAPSRWDRRG